MERLSEALTIDRMLEQCDQQKKIYCCAAAKDIVMEQIGVTREKDTQFL